MEKIAPEQLMLILQDIRAAYHIAADTGNMSPLLGTLLALDATLDAWQGENPEGQNYAKHNGSQLN